MLTGEVIAARFEVERLAGSGGMGRVYRAVDRTTGQPVALKVVTGADEQLAERFAREAQILAAVEHPSVVRYVAHGATPAGEPYLVMEWLEGETLAEHLKRRGLTVAESVAVGGRVASALGAMHRAGIVHRDLKPGNVFLVGGSLEAAKILDMGVARRIDARSELTRTGVMLGTPGYMAPEQARGEREVDARADVFALGCLLFKCLTGVPAFAGDDALTVLLKIVLEDPPTAHELNDEVPEELSLLVGRLLAKLPSQRPRDGDEVATSLLRLGHLRETGRARASTMPPSLTTTERRVMCLVLARVRRTELAATVFGGGAGAPGGAADLHALVAPFGGKLDVLADGSALVALASPGAPTDLAARAARCALLMRTALPEVPMAIVAGHGVVSARSPMSEAIDRGVRLLGRKSAGVVRIDAVTAGLLDARFDVSGDGDGLTLRGERDAAESTRTLLGKPTPCVGREQELGILDAVFSACVAEPVARAVLVTASAGVGKSRLRYEFLRRLEQRGDGVQIWLGRGDPMSAGSPFGILASAVRRAAGILDGEPIAVRRRKLHARLGRHLPAADHARAVEFIGELVGVPSADEASVQLRTARKDPTRMGYQMRRAWEDLIFAECSAGPVLLVLEDMHWGDLPTVNFVDAALRHARDLPLMVLALARPEVAELFPKLWAEREVQPIRLGQLTRKASERLVREVLGKATEDATVARLAERSAGNAFYLEELIRSVAEGKGDTLPDTILAMAEARLERLEPEARRVLRAASVFGQVFSKSGVAALLGGRGRGAPSTARTPDSEMVNAWLDGLVAREVISRRGAGDPSAEEEYAFRHALVREAAYAMLTDADRELGHRLAAEFLERTGGADAMSLAEHFERGGEPARAIGWYLRAAAQALEGNDFDAVLARVRRATDCGASGTALGELLLFDAEARRWRGDLAEAVGAAEAAMERLPRGGEDWCRAARELALSAATAGRHERLAAIAAELEAATPAEGASGLFAIASATLAVRLFYAGRGDLADALFARLERAELEARDEPAVLAEIHQARGYRAHFQGDLSALLREATLSQQSFEQAGELRNAVQQHVNAGYASLELGDAHRAEQTLRSALARAERLGLPAVAGLAKHNLGLALARLGKLEEARTVERESLSSAMTLGHRRQECGARLYLAQILAEEGSLEAAEREVRAALAAAEAAPLLRPKALATLARVELAAGRVDAALATAREAHALLESLGAIEEGEPLVRLVYAEALHAARDEAGARAAIGAARERLRERAGRIGDVAHRASYLAAVPENARTLELATAWAGDDGAGVSRS